MPFDDFPTVYALIDEDSKRWKVDALKALFLPFEVETIFNILLSYNLPKDKLIWVGNNRGEFSVKSAYYITLNVQEVESVLMVLLEFLYGKGFGS